MLAWDTKYPPKNDAAAAAVEASAPPPRTPDRRGPAAAANLPDVQVHDSTYDHDPSHPSEQASLPIY